MSKIILALLSLTLIITGCSKENSLSDSHKTLRVDIGGEPSSIDPALVEEATAFRVVNDLFAGIIDYTQSNNPIPGMASNFELSPDGKTYTFHLRHGLNFSDGSPIKASDFVYSWQRLVNPKTSSSYSFILEDIVNAKEIIAGKMNPNKLGVAAPDDYTVVVNLTNPSTNFLDKLTVPGTYVVPRKAIEKYGAQWTKPEHIITSGAYVLKEHIVNGYLLADKNPHYYAADAVTIPQVKYFPIRDTNVSIDTYKAGQLDTTWQSVPVNQYLALKAQYPQDLHTTLSERLRYISFNLKQAKYANNLKLRQALSLAVDRQVLVKQSLQAGETALYSAVTPTIENGAFANSRYDWSNWARDAQIKLAKQLYHDAGYGASKPLELTLLYTSKDVDKKVALTVASMWHEVLGVNVKLANQEYRMFLQSVYKGDFDIALTQFGADFNSVATYLPIYSCGNVYNYAHYCNNNYDELLKQAAGTSDVTAKRDSYQQAIMTLLKDYPIIPLYEPTRQRLVSSRVHNYDIEHNYLDNVQSKWMIIRDNDK
jgi:oligopeptide transport system substrate-binding protein